MRYASVRAPVLGWLSCLVLVACTGRSSLNDFANGSTDTVKGRPGGGNGNANGDEDGGGNGNTADGGDDDGGGDNNNGNANDGNNGGNNGNGNDGKGIGEACTDAEQCTGRSATCLEELNVFNFITVDFPGGYCTQTDCEEDTDCPTGSRCFTSIPNQSFCAKTCRANSECRTRENYSCTTAPLSQEPQTYCLPPINFPGGGGGQGSTRG